MSPKIGDLVMRTIGEYCVYQEIGVVLRILNNTTAPCLVEVMWNDGSINQAWSDELEMSNE